MYLPSGERMVDGLERRQRKALRSHLVPTVPLASYNIFSRILIRRVARLFGLELHIFVRVAI